MFTVSVCRFADADTSKPYAPMANVLSWWAPALATYILPDEPSRATPCGLENEWPTWPMRSHVELKIWMPLPRLATYRMPSESSTAMPYGRLIWSVMLAMLLPVPLKIWMRLLLRSATYILSEPSVVTPDAYLKPLAMS